ncbi:hypothetical protein JCM5296_000959 [Sporobolomyces johnsonii]
MTSSAEALPAKIVDAVDKACPQRLRHLSAYPPFSTSLALDLPVSLILQHPGELVVVDGKALHWGLNAGKTVTSTINLEPTLRGCGWGGCECVSMGMEEEEEEEEESRGRGCGRGKNGGKKGKGKGRKKAKEEAKEIVTGVSQHNLFPRVVSN